MSGSIQSRRDGCHYRAAPVDSSAFSAYQLLVPARGDAAPGLRSKAGPTNQKSLMAMNEMTVSSINDRAAEEYYKRAVDAEKEANHEKAVEFYERALSENPDHEQA